MKLEQDILDIKAAFTQAKKELFVVGGAVRDFHLGVNPKDIDLVTNALPDEIIAILKSLDIVSNIIEVGKSFGVIKTITKNGNDYEIATYRKDTSSGRKPTVEFSNIDFDSKRRDFSFNALYYDIERNEIIDLVGGLDDLKNGIVNTVGIANDRFLEDKLRKLRCLRFSNRLGFELSKNIITSLSKDNSLDGVSAERIREEFIKSIQSTKSLLSLLADLEKFKLFQFIFPNLIISDIQFHSNDKDIVIASLLKDNLNVAKILNRIAYSKEEISNIMFLINLKNLNFDTAFELKQRQKLITLTNKQILDFAKLNKLNVYLIAYFLKYEITTSGDDLLKQGFKEGLELAQEKRRIEKIKFMELCQLS